MIHDVVVQPLTVNADERGYLMEMLREDDEIFEHFGQAYVSLNYPGVIRAWHYHKKQSDFWTVPKGMVKAVIYDCREGSSTYGEVNEFFLGDFNQVRLRIPKGVYHGFKCIGETEAMIINVPTELYNYQEPDEFRAPAHDPSIPYDWARKDR